MLNSFPLSYQGRRQRTGGIKGIRINIFSCPFIFGYVVNPIRMWYNTSYD